MPQGYKDLISYQLSKIAFDLGWEFVPVYFVGSEFGRQRDQIYQDLRSHKHPASTFATPVAYVHASWYHDYGAREISSKARRNGVCPVN